MILKEYVSAPRERLAKFGVGALSDAELLAILLRTGSQRENALVLAERLLRHDLAGLSYQQLCSITGIGPAKACSILAALAFVGRLQASDVHMVKNVNDVVAVMQAYLSVNQECFWGVYVDARHRLLGVELLFKGTLDAVMIHPREIFAKALEKKAAGVIVVHNHPSGDSSPSVEDVRFTKQLLSAARLLKIPLLDHVILGDEAFSFKEQTDIKF